MSKVFIFLFTLFGNGVKIDKVDYCELDVDHLDPDSKLEMAIGCSTINGKNAYNDRKLKAIYERGGNNVSNSK